MQLVNCVSAFFGACNAELDAESAGQAPLILGMCKISFF